MIVMKFGGSSLRDAVSLKQVVNIIGQEKAKGKIIVLSAVYGVTNHLYESVAKAIENERCITALINYLHTVHKELIVGGISSTEHRHRALDEIECRLARLEKLLFGISYTGECTMRTMEKIVTTGERMAVHLLAESLLSHGLKACALEADVIDIIASGYWGYGNVDYDQTEKMLPNHLLPHLNQGIIPVITGFFGRTPDNHTITFGRGGTDYSAAVVANAMNAEELQIWKDVDGFLTASPEVVKNPKPVHYLAYDEAAELAYFGAEILHPRTVEPLHEKMIPIVIKNTYRPDFRGTAIGPERHTQEDIVKSVTFNRKLGILKCLGAGLGCQIGFLKEVMNALSDHDVNIRSVVTSQTAVSLLLELKDLEKSTRILKALKIPYLEALEEIPDIAVIAVIGEGIAETKGLAARVLSAVASKNINVNMMSSGASPVAYYFLVQEKTLKNAIRAIHAEFFEKTTE